MKGILLGLLLAGLAGVAEAGQAEYDNCILDHLKGAKLDVAASLIQQACYENTMGPFYPNDAVRQYNSCLLEHLVGVESFRAAMEIRSACGSKYLR